MQQSSILPSTHHDLITDAAYDFFGRRLATASADQRIKVWRRAQDGTWDVEEDMKAHDAPIAKIVWSHPEHGPLLASCSYDRTVRIWEEKNEQQRNSGKRWLPVHKISDARGSVRDIAFAPSEFGLRLATISSDSYLRLYAPSLPSVSDWFSVVQIYLPSLSSSSSSTSPSTSHKPLPPTVGEGGISRMLHRAGGTTGSAEGAGSSSGMRESGSGTGNGSGGASSGEVLGGGRCLSWCKEKWWGMVLAVAEGIEGQVKLISLPHPTPPVHLLTLSPPKANTSSTSASAVGSQTITSLAWAPSCGRDYHLIATGNREGVVRIWKVSSGEGEDGLDNGEGWKGKMVAEFAEHGRTITTVDWNATGTILSTSADDGKVRLWKATYSDRWDLKAVFEAQPSDTMDGEGDAMMG